MKNIITLFTISAILLFIHNNIIIAQAMQKEVPKISVFPLGEKLPDKYREYFTGDTYLAQLSKNTELNCPIFNVTFEPGCRNNWHSHSSGQILISVGGKGYYQAKGELARILFPGNIVEIPANVIHWHGASPMDWFSHLAIETNHPKNENTWLEEVDDEQYEKSISSVERKNIKLSENAIKTTISYGLVMIQN